MSYRWPLDPKDLFAERYAQMVNTGLPEADATQMRTVISEMWEDRPGGWVHEWSRLAAGYADDGRHDLAALAYGWAKFPALADDAKRAAFERQIEQYQLASPTFPVSFTRSVLTVPYLGSTTAVPVHLLAQPELPSDAPVLIASGGVDTWKMDVHALFVGFAMATPFRVLAFDIPGTGESAVPLDPYAREVVDGLTAAARDLGNGKVAHLGISMGGYFSAYTGLAGQVDAAIVLGGPVEEAFSAGRGWQFGMDGIVGNAMGFDHQPTPDEMAAESAALSLRWLLDQDTNSPMLVINGADDVHIPQHDTLVFTGRRDTRVALMPGTGHCAVSKLGEVVLTMIDWLAQSVPASEIQPAHDSR